MTIPEATELATYLGGLYPGMTSAQTAYWAEKFEVFDDASLIRKCIVAHFDAHHELNGPMLLADMKQRHHAARQRPIDDARGHGSNDDVRRMKEWYGEVRRRYWSASPPPTTGV